MNNSYKIIKELSYFFGNDDINIDSRTSVFIKLFILKHHNYDVNNCISAKNYNNNLTKHNDLDHNIVDFIIDTAINHRNYLNYKNILINNIYNKWWSLDSYSRNFYLKNINVEKLNNSEWSLMNETEFTNMNNENIRIVLKSINLTTIKGPLFISYIPKISTQVFNDIWFTNKYNKLVNITHEKWTMQNNSDDILKSLYFHIYNNILSDHHISVLFANLPNNIISSNKKFDISIQKLVDNIIMNNTQHGGDQKRYMGIGIHYIWNKIFLNIKNDLTKINKSFDIKKSSVPILLRQMLKTEDTLVELKEYLEDYTKYIELFKDYNTEIINEEKLDNYVLKYRELQNEQKNNDKYLTTVLSELLDSQDNNEKYQDI